MSIGLPETKEKYIILMIANYLWEKNNITNIVFQFLCSKISVWYMFVLRSRCEELWRQIQFNEASYILLYHPQRPRSHYIIVAIHNVQLYKYKNVYA